MAIPLLLIKILQFFGVYAAEKAIDASVDHALNGKDKKRRDAQLREIHDSVGESNSILKSLANESSEIIREAASQITTLIETLHVVTAHAFLDDLRKKVKATDRKTLARIDYYRGCCSRYINRDQCINEYNLAWQEMTEDGVYDPEIVGGKIYVHCLKNEQSAATLAADKLKTICRGNVWAWIPSLLFSDNLEQAFSELPDDVDRMLILANCCMLGNNRKSLGVDINSYKAQFPDTLTHENIPLWFYNLSVLLNVFIREWAETPMGEYNAPIESAKCLFISIGKLKELEQRTQLKATFGDLDFWYSISGCQINPTDDLIEMLRTSDCQPDFEEYRVVAYVVCLAKQGDEHDESAKEYLNSAIVTPATLNQRFLLSLKTMDPAYANETFRLAIEKDVVFPHQLIIYALSAIKNFKEQVNGYANRIKIENELDAQAYQQICHYYFGKEIDVKFLQENKNKVSRPYIPFIAIILHDSGFIEEGTELMRKVLPRDRVELISQMYVELLSSNRCHAEEYYTFLRHVRVDLGYTENRIWLQNEYYFASQLPDTQSMVEIARILHEKYPDQKNYYIAYLSSLSRNNNPEIVKELSRELNDYDFEPLEAIEVFHQLIYSNILEEAVEFLYNYVLRYHSNEALNLEFHRASMVTVTERIIHKEYDEVFDGAYIHFKQDGQLKSTVIDASNRDAFLIGLKVGEQTEKKDLRGNPVIYEIVSVHNKYHQLVERIYHDIGENKYNSVRSIQFTDDEMQSGRFLELFNNLAGRDPDWRSKQREIERQYKDGKISLAVFLHEDSLIVDIYNHLFGDFKYYNYPKSLLSWIFERQNVSIEKLTPVFDLVSVILAFELHLLFQLDYGKFVIPESLISVLEYTIQNNKYGFPSGVYQQIISILAPHEPVEEEDWTVTRLKNLLSWIKENGEIIRVTERLNQDPEPFKKSSYLAVFYDSLSLLQEHRVLITGDKALLTMFVNRYPLADLGFLVSHLFPKEYREISHFFMRANIYGGDIDSEYVFSEYLKHCSDQESSFIQCKQNLMYCPNLYDCVFSVCERIMGAPILNSADELVVEELMIGLFGAVRKDAANLMLQRFTLQTSSARLKRIMLGAIKSVYPLS